MTEDRSRGFTGGSVPEAYDQFMAPQLFEPWARELVGRARLRRGSSVLDVASGPGPVARLAASAVGPEGRVVASDISPAMLAVAAAKPAAATSAPIEYVECSATALEAASDSFDAVLCQQGLQFFPDRAASVGEMRRVARRDGVVVVSTWASERPLGLFGPMAEVLQLAGVAEPYPRAFDPQSYSLSSPELSRLLSEAGLREVVVETVELDAVWRDTQEAVATVMGTPYGPKVNGLPVDKQQQVYSLLAGRLGQSPDGTVIIRTTSHIGRGTK
jgi:ubiquinone/menaquinone biosynthesis C-methylase UbiE